MARPTRQNEDADLTLEDLIFKRQQENKKKLIEEEKKQKLALVDFLQAAERKGMQVSAKMQSEFLAQYEKKRKEEEKKAATKELLDYFKERSKQFEKEEKRREKQLERELEVAKLLAKDDDGKGPGLANRIKADMKENAAVFSKAMGDLGKELGKRLVNIGDALTGEINTTISSFAKYQSSINTRLQGTADTFQTIQKSLTSVVGMNPYIKTAELLEGLNELVGQGIAHNLEQRAFLSSVSDKIATTFDVANAAMLRIIRLQQQDTTASRLGMEAYLTQYFNEMFRDTTYLTNSFDSVAEALFEASAQMSASESIEFEYIVQKWLGSLSAVGVGTGTLQSIAEAIGYLGSGNISALEGSSAQNLLVMAASRAGQDYSTLLTEGLTQTTTNVILKSLVEYMQEIGTGASNVVKSQFAETFGVTIADLKAVAGLGTADLNRITSSTMGYADTIFELGNQLDAIQSRVSIAEQIQNVMANLKYGIGRGIAEDPFMAGMWSITDLIQGVTGGIAIPYISVLGTGIDLNTTVENLVKTGMIGVSTLGKIGELFTGLENAGNMRGLIGALNLGELTQTTRGTGARTRPRGLSTSSSSLIVTRSGSDIEAQSLSAASQPAQQQLEEQKATEKGVTDIFTLLSGNILDTLRTMTGYLGTMAGYDERVTSINNSITLGVDALQGIGTQVAVSLPVDDSVATNQLDELKTISGEVKGIHSILRDGAVNVNVMSMPQSNPFGGL